MSNDMPVFVGLDYHQHSVQVSVVDGAGKMILNRGCANEWEKIVGLAQGLGRVQRVAIEACCGAADLASELRREAGWTVDLAHPQYVSRMKRSPDKSDFSDGRMLADLTRVGYLPTVWLPGEFERDLRQQVNYRQKLVDQRRAVKLRVCAILRERRVKAPPDYARWTVKWMRWIRQAPGLRETGCWLVGELLDELDHLNKKVQKADEQLERFVGEDALTKRLLEEPGIGPVTAWVLRGLVGRFDRFGSGKQLSRYCGLSPCNASSGARVADAGLISGCNRLLRATMIQAAHRLMRCQRRWIDLRLCMESRGKPACVIAAAVANRWVRGLWHRLATSKAAEPAEALKSL